jgi:putative pre-16S rRNA nuclease
VGKQIIKVISNIILCQKDLCCLANLSNVVDASDKTSNNPSMTQPSEPLANPLPAGEQVPAHGALLGLDFGTKRWGVAVCNSDQTIAVSVETWQVRTPEQNLKHLRELIDDYRAVGFVVGLPVRLNGVEGDQAAVVRRFGNWLAEQTQLPVAYWDERYSSTEAEVLLWSQGVSPAQSKERLDRLAAQIILQAYLDAPDRTRPPAAKV